jgi:hypothetical protein
MNTWYESKVKYLKVDQGGFERKQTDTFLIDAVSYTDAESRVYAIMKELTNGEFIIMNIKQSNITEIISKLDGEWWYKAKISLITLDEEAGREKKINQYILVAGNDLKDAQKQLEEGLSCMLISYVAVSIAISPICEVFPYVPIVVQNEVTGLEELELTDELD